MSEPSFAQRLLSLFSEPAHAESIVGDLTEESCARGRGWFWLQILCTAPALCLASIRAAPWRSLSLGFAALVAWLGIYLVLAEVTGLFRFLWYFDPTDFDRSLNTVPHGFWIRVVVVVSGTNFLTGMIFARLASTRAMSGSAPLVALWLASWVTWPVLAQLVYSLSWYWIIGGTLAFPFFYLIPLLVGSVLARRRTA
jgi:hypothetical protein